MRSIKIPDRLTPKFIQKVLEQLNSGIVLLPTEFDYVFCSSQRERLEKLAQNSIFQFIPLPSDKNSGLSPIRSLLPGPLIVYITDEKAEKIGIRCSASPLIDSILKELPNQKIFFIETLEDDLKDLGSKVNLRLKGTIKRVLVPTILDLSLDPPVILRKGAIPILTIENVLKKRCRLSKDLYFSVLLVCTGNSCRSPIAKGILDKRLKERRVFVYSAGTSAAKGLLPSEFAISAAQELGADISSHLSQPLEVGLIQDADLILVMSTQHKERVLEMVPEAAPKTFLLREYSEGVNEEIPDPIGAPYETFQEVAALIDRNLTKVVDDITERVP